MRKLSHPRVVVGVDHSLAGYEALRTAVRIARCYRLPLHAVRSEPAIGVEENYVEGVFKAALGDIPADLDVKAEAVPNGVRQALLDSATDPQDVIVVGNDGRGAFRALWSGSVGHSLLKRARCQLVLVPAPEMRRATRRSLRKLCRSRTDVWDRFEAEVPLRGRPFQDM